MNDMNRSALLPLLLAGATTTLAACGTDAATSGTLVVRVQAEEVVVSGLASGDASEDIRDGWSVTFDRYLAVLGNVRLRPSSGGSASVTRETLALDLTSIPEVGAPLITLSDIAPGRYEFGFESVIADSDTGADDSVAAADLEDLVKRSVTYAITGTLAAEGGRSCPPQALADIPTGAQANGKNDAGDACYDNPQVTFEINAKAATAFGPCEVDGVPGISVRDSGETTATITIHGDHLFFNGFPEGAESTITRRAQWLADCDLDLSGDVSEAELKSIPLSALSELDSDRYQLGGAPIALVTVWDYVRAQLMTQGHFQGEGECPYAPIE